MACSQGAIGSTRTAVGMAWFPQRTSSKTLQTEIMMGTTEITLKKGEKRKFFDFRVECVMDAARSQQICDHPGNCYTHPYFIAKQ